MDLIHHWIRHYQAFDFDDYSVTLNSQKENFRALDEAYSIFRAAGFSVSRNLGRFDAGKLRRQIMNLYCSGFDKNDFIVTADSDEFQNVKENYRDFASDYDIIYGKLVDRYDDTLHNADPDVPLSSQYPYAADLEKIIIKTFRLPPGAWIEMRKEKVLCSRVNIPVAFGGSHCVYPSHTELFAYHPDIFDVYHYTWRESIIPRMCGRHYFNAAMIWYVKEFFGLEDVPESLHNKIEEHEKIQIAKGWA